MDKKTMRKKQREYDRYYRDNLRHDGTTFDEALDFLTNEARYFVLDALACTLHNEGYGLSGNTEESDALWLARQMAARETGDALSRWDVLPAEVQAQWIKLAEIAIDSLPMLADRIANRYIRMKEALNFIIRHEKYYAWKGYTYADHARDPKEAIHPKGEDHAPDQNKLD